MSAETKNKSSPSGTVSSSGGFRTTHRIIAELSKHSDWTIRQVQDLCSAAIHNPQIGRILGDFDVLEFYKSLFDIKDVMNSTDEIISTLAKRIVEVDTDYEDEKPDLSWWS